MKAATLSLIIRGLAVIKDLPESGVAENSADVVRDLRDRTEASAVSRVRSRIKSASADSRPDTAPAA